MRRQPGRRDTHASLRRRAVAPVVRRSAPQGCPRGRSASTAGTAPPCQRRRGNFQREVVNDTPGVPRDLPAGTVTFLFTDIEGSTRLLHEHGERYAELLGEHRRVLREAFARHGGVEVDTQGDAFFVAFARASDAIAAASDGQAALRGGPISVRMGLHTGEPVVTEEGYVGIDVHRAARIAAAGHGGQVLLSQATRDLVAGEDCSRPRRAPSEGPLGARAPVPARRRRLPAPEDAVPDEPARPGDAVSRPRARARRGRRPAAPRGRPAADAHRPRRDREDAAGAAGRGRGRRGRPRRRLVGFARPASRPGARARRGREGARRAGAARLHARGDARRLARREAGAPVDRQRRAPAAAGRDRDRTAPRVRRAEAARDEQGAASAAGRARLAVPSLDDHDGTALFTARARALRPAFSGDAGDRGALRAPRQPPARARARGRTRPDLLARAAPRAARGRRRAQGRPRRRPAPADPRRDDPLVVRPPRAGRAAAVRAACGVRGRLHVRGGRGRVRGGRRHAAVADRQEPRPQPRGGGPRSVLDARDDPRVRGERARSVRRGRRPEAAATPSSSRHSRSAPIPTCDTAPTSSGGSNEWRRTTTTSAPR